MRDEHVGRFATGVRQESPSLPGRPKAGSHGRVVELVSEPVVSGNPLTMPGTVHGVVTEPVTELAACRAGSVFGINWVTKPISQSGDELLGLEEEAKGSRGDGCQPIAGVRVGKAHAGQPCNLPLAPLPGKFFGKKVVE